MKPCPKNPNHEVREDQIGNNKYDYCTECKEDVAFIARQMQPQVAAAVEEFDDEDDDQDEEDQMDFDADEDDEDDMDLDGDDDQDALNVMPPVPHNPRPVRNMGNATGTHQIVLQNNPNTGAHLVSQILNQVFRKDRMESEYIMMDAHYHGQAVCAYVNQDEGETLLAEINRKKEEIANGHSMGANTVTELEFRLERRQG